MPFSYFPNSVATFNPFIFVMLTMYLSCKGYTALFDVYSYATCAKNLGGWVFCFSERSVSQFFSVAKFPFVLIIWALI